MRRNGPWQITASEVKYKNQWLELVEDQVIRPDGEPGHYSTVRVIPGVAVLPVDDDGFAYLVQQFRYPLGREVLEVPGGGRSASEDPQACGARELKEEMGIEAEEWTGLGAIDIATSIMDCRVELFLARKLSFGAHEREGSEVMQTRKMKLEEARARAMAGEITQAAACVLILKAAAHLGL